MANTSKQKTKKAQAITIFKRGLRFGKTRGEILAQLQTRLDMTPATARNYYQRIQSGAWPI